MQELFVTLFNTIFSGISIGSVLLLASLGLAIVFGLMGVINLAHGELMMLGAYTTFVVQNIFKPLGDSWFALYIWIALPLAFLVAALAGFALERGVIRFLYGRPLETLLATWGVSLILQQFVRSVNWAFAIGIVLFSALFFGGLFIVRRRPDWELIRSRFLTILLPVSGGIAIAGGLLLNKANRVLSKPWFSARNVDVTAPKWLREGWKLGEGTNAIQLPYSRLFIIALTIVCVLAIYWFLNRSDWGLKIRSVTQNRSMSACLGISTDTVDSVTFAIGSGLAGIAGCAICLLGSVGPNTGQNYIVDAFMVVVVGGVGNLLGTIIAALALGIISYLIGSGTFVTLLTKIDNASLQPLLDFFTFFATSTMAKVMVFTLIIAFLQVKPSGIFALKGRTAEL
jgi:urea transport system permease protein